MSGTKIIIEFDNADIVSRRIASGLLRNLDLHIPYANQTFQTLCEKENEGYIGTYKGIPIIIKDKEKVNT